ncbi:MAG: vWA domain-containing protein [Desulfomonilia bacterium]
MFAEFFFLLREKGVPITPSGFLRLQESLHKGLVCSLDDLYSVSRAVMIKSERYFDVYDRVFAHFFKGADLSGDISSEIDMAIQAMLEEWLKDPQDLAEFLGIDAETLASLTPDELEEYFRQRLKEQTERHDGGNRWIGTGGTSPVGHSGYHPGGMRVGGQSRSKSAVKVALDRRYKDYTEDTRLGPSQISEALRRLRHMKPVGPKDTVNIEKTIYQTMKNAGEIEIIFERSLRDKLNIILMIDNGGFSMDPYVNVVQVLFNHTKNQFKDLQNFYFHNTIYNRVWRDPQRYEKPVFIDEFSRYDPETRLIIVGDASMAPYELFSRNGSIYYSSQSEASIKKLEILAKTFKHCAWLNPKYEYTWPHTQTIGAIRDIFPMFEITLQGLEKAIAHLMKKN